MKRFSVFALLLFVLFGCFAPPAFAAESDYQLYINGESFDYDYPPIVHNNAIYVPLWGILGKLGMSADAKYGVVRINHPYRILLLNSDTDKLIYYGRSMDRHAVRLEYPAVVKNDVIYVPLVFLSEYLSMQVAWGENGRIDITAGDFAKGVSWGNSETIENDRVQFVYDTWAESFWSAHKTLWTKKPFSVFNRFESVAVVGYSGTTVTLAGASGQKTIAFKDYNDISGSLSITDPLAAFSWPESVKNTIRQGKVSVGMTKEQALLSWGEPTKINRDTYSSGTFEQWVYRPYYGYDSDYLYFKNGTLTSIQTSR